MKLVVTGVVASCSRMRAFSSRKFASIASDMNRR